MRERAKLSGGRFTVISTPEKGTTIRVAWHPEESGAVTD
jgi:signal transduction histidine kinase